MEVKQTELMCRVETEEEVLEYVAAVIQLYREQGHYLDRVYKWLARVGMDSVQEAIVENASTRRELFERFKYSQKFSQHDPWAARAHERQVHGLRHMKQIKRVSESMA